MNYVISGSLYKGVPFEDFFPEPDEGFPRVTISTEDADDMLPEDESYMILPPESKDWIDVVVRKLDREIAIKVISDIVGQPVEIIERGQVMAI